MDDNGEISIFTQKVRKSGGSFEITLDSKICEFEGIKEGDYVKIIIHKLTKKEE